VRDFHSLLCIKEIISHFDVVAVQEVRENLRALRHMLKALGPDWGVILTDVTRGDEGNLERMAFVFDTRRVKPSGLACEIVLPESILTSGVIDRQFARTPYAVSFLSGSATFILVTLHVIYGSGPADRIPELNAIADWLEDWARRENSWDHNLIALGDFNIDRRGDEMFEAFTSTGLRAPDELNDAPRTIFASGADNFYDQIAWFRGAGDVPALSLKYADNGGYFDFENLVFDNLDTTGLSWRISDHYPLWVEFLVE
jgi:endonuclease/exonuclease/phosphatase family metal-dependent hydrolase